MEKSKIEKALEMVQGKLRNGATWYGHDVEQVEAALKEAVELEKASKPAKGKK